MDEILKNVSYDPETGLFTKLHNRGRPTRSNVAGYNRSYHGYIIIGINGVQYHSHRLAWFVVHGYDPVLQIDHINGIRHDNRIANLREVNSTTQGRNKALISTNSSGIMGVRWNSTNNCWTASIGIDRNTIYLGSYLTFDEAKAARFAAEKVVGFHENHGRENCIGHAKPPLNPFEKARRGPPVPPSGLPTGGCSPQTNTGPPFSNVYSGGAVGIDTIATPTIASATIEVE